MNFGDNLKKILDEKGISQRQFGFKVGKEAEGHLCVVAVKESAVKQLGAYTGEVALKAYL